MDESILKSVKITLNLQPEYEVFDDVVLMHINTVFSTLNQLGVGPTQGFMIQDAGQMWSEFLGNDPGLNHVKTYVYLRVRLLFDPPSTGYHVAAMQKQIEELEWRLNAQREDTKWVEPTPPVVLLEE